MSPTSSEFLRPSNLPQSARRMLLVFDGGNAPGYSSVAVALTEEGLRHGYEVWAATEGFRSLTTQATQSLRFERLVVSRQERYTLLAAGQPARSMGRRVQDAGSDFRSERFAEFTLPEHREHAANMFRAQGFTHLVCVGGNGTLDGCRAWLEAFGSERPVTGFINVSVDNDVAGDRAIGFLSGVEVGANTARGLYEDGYTHKRIYALEMMGNRSGRHALHCGVAARAHLVVLPFFQFPDPVLEEIASRLNAIEHGLVVVAEGYELERRRKLHVSRSAAGFFLMQLEAYGLRDRPERRVIAEPFSRYLRGVRPGFADVAASFIKVSLLLSAFDRGETEIMPFVLAAHDVGVRAFSEIKRDDRVERSFLPLLDRLGVPLFRSWVEQNFSSGDVSI
ncbi:MAG TPA: 6-phosphofructokinase [Polyangiales bacterium]|jgi:6-phosphofructokinase|nr:6-phosphofructokinase [Polyangiales bacterium]